MQVAEFEIRHIPDGVEFITINSSGIVQGWRYKPRMRLKGGMSMFVPNPFYPEIGIILSWGDDGTYEPKLFEVTKKVVELKEIDPRW